MDTGTKIRLIRESKKLSREVLADLLQMSVNTFKKIESGERAPNIEEIKLLANEFDIDPQIFYRESSIFQSNGDHSPAGNGNNNNIVMMDKDLLKTLITTLDNLNQFLLKQ